MINSFAFIGGPHGDWQVTRFDPVRGASLAPVAAVSIVPDGGAHPAGAAWVLRGITSNMRYTTRQELDALQHSQPALGRPTATLAAMIPLRKSAQWWTLPQDERRAIFEDTSHHTRIGLEYLPAVARRLHHCRDLGEPFDFVTWFEFAEEHASAFDELVARLRRTREWDYVEREVDIRLRRG